MTKMDFNWFYGKIFNGCLTQYNWCPFLLFAYDFSTDFIAKIIFFSWLIIGKTSLIKDMVNYLNQF